MEVQMSKGKYTSMLLRDYHMLKKLYQSTDNPTKRAVYKDKMDYLRETMDAFYVTGEKSVPETIHPVMIWR